jgi:hypothetical protein
MDNAWTFNRIDKNPGYKIDMRVYSIEGNGKYETDYHYFTNFSEKKSDSLCDASKESSI